MTIIIVCVNYEQVKVLLNLTHNYKYITADKKESKRLNGSNPQPQPQQIQRTIKQRERPGCSWLDRIAKTPVQLAV